MDPTDTSCSKFKKEEVLVNDCLGLIEDRFDNEEFGKPEHYNDDLPLQMCEILEQDIFLKL